MPWSLKQDLELLRLCSIGCESGSEAFPGVHDTTQEVDGRSILGRRLLSANVVGSAESCRLFTSSRRTVYSRSIRA